MRKEYKSPMSVVLSITTDSIITASDGDMVQVNVWGESTIDGGKAWSRLSQDSNSIWEDEDEE